VFINISGSGKVERGGGGSAGKRLVENRITELRKWM